MPALEQLKKRLRPGQVYRRADLARWSNAVDRHLRQLVEEGRLSKVSGGLYMTPKKTRYGDAPPDPEKLVAGFLKDDRFLMMSPNVYNALGVGATQLYNETVVYNHKRHGRHVLAGRPFEFRMKPVFPRTLSREFLLVDLVNNVDRLAEDRERLLHRAKGRAREMDAKALARSVQTYGGLRAKRTLGPVAGAGQQDSGAQGLGAS